TFDGGLCASLYAASEVTARVGDGSTVKIKEMTDYPFGDSVTLEMSLDKPVEFPLYLRIPHWCDKPELEINGEPASVAARAPAHAVIKHTWKDRDQIKLHLPMRVEVVRWVTNHKAASVNCGPLSFSLKINENWQRAGGTDDWPDFEVSASSPWNYGLVL